MSGAASPRRSLPAERALREGAEQLAFDIARRLRVGTPGEREAIYRMLGESAAQPPLVDALAAGRFVQTEGEYEALAGVYGQRLGGALDAEVRADLLDLFDLAEGRPELVAGARAKLWEIGRAHV